MGDVRDTFAGPDGALAAADTGQAPAVLRGSATRRDGRGLAQQAGTVVAYDAGAGGADARLHLDLGPEGGGQALLARVVDASNLWSLNLRQYSYSYPTGTATIYTWGQTYQSDYNIINGIPAQTATISSYQQGEPYFSPTMNGLPKYGGAYYVGSQQTTTYSSATAWELRLQLETSAGGRRTVQSTTMGSKPSSMQLNVSGNRLLAYLNGSTTLALPEVADTTHATSTRHGWGSAADAGSTSVDGFTVRPYNTPPLAPRLLSPRGAEAIDRTSRQRLSLEARDLDSGDTISRTTWRWRLKDSGDPWTVVDQRQPLAYLEVPANTWTAGVWEWQALTYDRVGAMGTWSGSEFLTAADPVPGPTWLKPVNGQTVGQSSAVVEWATDDQAAYRVRTVPDNAGVPGAPAAGYHDSGVVESSSARTHRVPFPTNGRREWLQVQVRGANGLWSEWVSIRLLVSYTPPARALLSLVPDLRLAAIVVTIIDPPPAPGAPAALSHEVYVRPRPTATAPPTEGVRVAVDVLPSSAYVYRFPAAGQELEVRVTTAGANGTSDPGEWTSTSTTTNPGTGGNLYGRATYDTATYG